MLFTVVWESEREKRKRGVKNDTGWTHLPTCAYPHARTVVCWLYEQSWRSWSKWKRKGSLRQRETWAHLSHPHPLPHSGHLNPASASPTSTAANINRVILCLARPHTIPLYYLHSLSSQQQHPKQIGFYISFPFLSVFFLFFVFATHRSRHAIVLCFPFYSFRYSLSE